MELGGRVIWGIQEQIGWLGARPPVWLQTPGLPTLLCAQGFLPLGDPCWSLLALPCWVFGTSSGPVSASLGCGSSARFPRAPVTGSRWGITTPFLPWAVHPCV